jgi:hypothetical protein
MRPAFFVGLSNNCLTLSVDADLGPFSDGQHWGANRTGIAQLIEIVRTAQMICSESCAKKKRKHRLPRASFSESLQQQSSENAVSGQAVH